ncbi:MAG: hypothetical protein LLG02_10615 [Pelosinus sp.]|nr:hypothetical protein [Pelosinus sp.]
MYPNESFTICTRELQEKAQKLAAFPTTALNSGNAMIMYSMLLLNTILTEQAADPINNLEHILAISAALATLNNSIRAI